MNQTKRKHLIKLLLSLVALLASFALVLGSLYAWFVQNDDAPSLQFATDELVPQWDIAYWNPSLSDTNKWAPVPQTGEIGYLSPHFGQVDDLMHTSENSKVFFKMRMHALEAFTQYQITLLTVYLSLFEEENGDFVPVVASDVSLNYFDSSPSQACLQFETFVSRQNNLPPSALLFAAPPTSIQNEFLPLTGEQFLLDGEWLYLAFSLKEAELLNLCLQVPLRYFPYHFGFLFTFFSETRTVDYV